MPSYDSKKETVLPEGDYEFVVDDAGEKTSNKGNEQIELQLLVSDGNTKVRVFDNLVFIPSCYWKIDLFRECTGEKLIEAQGVSFEADDCIGRKGRLHLVIDTYNGRTRNKVGEYLPPRIGKGGVPVPLAAPVAAVANEPDDINF